MVDDDTSPLLSALREIRDEIRERVGETNEHLTTQTERLDRIDGRIDRIDGRIDGLADAMRQGHLRLATEVVAVAQAVGEVRDLLAERLDDRGRLDDHERRLRHLEQKVD